MNGWSFSFTANTASNSTTFAATIVTPVPGVIANAGPAIADADPLRRWRLAMAAPKR